MQEIIFYTTANETLGVVRDYANARTVSAPTLTRGVSVVLHMRLFDDANDLEPYPIAAFSNIVAWSFVMDTDFNNETAFKVVADNDNISVSNVEEEYTDPADAENTQTRHYTEFLIPIPNMENEALADWIGMSKSKGGLIGELVGYDLTGAFVFVLQIEGFTIRNRITGIPLYTSGVISSGGSTSSGDGSSIVSSGGSVIYAAPTVTANTSSPARSVTLTASYNSAVTSKQYSSNGSNWLTYSLGGVSVTTNGTRYFRGLDDSGNLTSVASYYVGNIDRTNPQITLSGNTGATVSDTLLATVNESATVTYSPNGSNWLTYSSGGIQITSNGTYYVKAVDLAGNSAVASITYASIGLVSSGGSNSNENGSSVYIVDDSDEPPPT